MGAAAGAALSVVSSPDLNERLFERRKYQRDWVQKRRKGYIAERGGTCQYPGCWCTIDLEWHHRIPRIRFTHRIFSYSKERIEAELNHCELLCKVHHRKAQKNTSRPREFCGL